MQVSPRTFEPQRKLYRNWLWAVILAICVVIAATPVAAQPPVTQYGRKKEIDNGPRAVGLVQIPAKGKARFTPIAIMLDGKFYDAGAYKATPVPMALEFGTVYEGFRSGVSQGLFTITQPGELNHNWIAEGTWLPAGAVDPHAKKKYAAPVIVEDPDGPPVLHRRKPKDSDSSTATKDSTSNKDTANKDTNNKDAAKTNDSKGQTSSTGTNGNATPAGGNAPASSTTSSSPSGTTATSTASTKPAADQKDSNKDSSKESSKVPATSTSASTTATTTTAANDDENIRDPNRPRLRRGKPAASAHHEPFVTFDALGDAAGAASPSAGNSDPKTGKDKSASVSSSVVIPAISDVGGPDPRPYLYDVKTSEVAGYRDQMLALAAVQLSKLPGATKEPQPAAKKMGKTGKPAKSPQLQLDDLSLRFFDLSNSNEPVFILSGKTKPPATGTPEDFLPKEITLIARTNLENEVQKLFFSATDAKHLDMTPRMQLIDAVDADGDGRGELLFRRTFDTGSAYAIYRVTADGLWPLFEGTP